MQELSLVDSNLIPRVTWVLNKLEVEGYTRESWKIGFWTQLYYLLEYFWSSICSSIKLKVKTPQMLFEDYMKKYTWTTEFMEEFEALFEF